MPNVNITPPPPIVVQVKGGKTTTISSPTGSATRLVELSDVTATPLANGDVLTYISANGKFEFHPGGGGSSNAFGIVNVAGQNNVIAHTSSDTLKFIAGTGILLTTDNVNNSLTVVATGGSAIDQFARDNSNGAFTKANNAYANANTAIYTAAQIRANISNTAPVNYDPSTGIISHALSGVTATTYGNTTFVPTITVDSNGHVSAVVNTAIAFPAIIDQFARDNSNGAFSKANTANVTGQAAFDKANSAIYTAAQIRANISNTTPILYDPATGIVSLTTVPVTLGGTGQVSYSNGDLLIGNTMSGGLDRANLTQGSGIQITNENGKITIHATAGKVYYFEYSGQSDVVPYHKLLSAPSTHAENTVVKSFTTISSFVLMTSFITEPGEPNVTLLPSGTYGRHIHATTGGNGHVAQLRIELYKYAANGLETLLRTADSPQFDAGNAVDLLSWNVTDPVGHDLVVTDRLLMKMYGTRITGGGGTVTITVYTEGNSRASYATTSIQGIAGAGVTSVAGRVGAVLLNTNDVTENAAGPYYFTAAKVRANISNTAPINYNSTTGVISLPSTANGQTLIGNTVSGAFDVATLTQGTGISITNDKGSITIAATGGASGNGFGIIAVAGQSNVVAHMANDVFNLVQGTGIVITTDITTNAVTIAATGGSAIDQFARDHGNGAFDKANSAIFTAAQIRANISNAYPVYYDATTGVVSFVPATANGQTLIGNTVSGTFDVNTIAQTAPVIVVNGKGTVTLSHASSGVVATVYGNASIVPSVTVDAFGHITGAVNTTIAIDAAAIATGILSVVRGGTGQSAYTNGQILIGNTGSTGLDKATIAQSAPIIITNLQGSITVSHARSGVVALDSYGSQSIIPVMAVDANGHLTAVVNTAIGGLGTGVLTTGILPVSRGGTGLDATGIVNGSIHVGNTVNVGFDTTTIAQTAPVIVVNGKGTITLSHASSGVTAKTYGSASLVPAIAVDAFGHVTSVVNTGIVIDASAIGSGVLLVAQGGTGQSVYANGQLLIGNTGSGGLDKATIAQSAPIIITNLQGSITVSHARSGVTALDSYGSGAIIPVIAVDANGHLTAVVNTAIAGLSTGVLTTGILPVARGGTGKDATGLANGQLLIGNTVNTGFDLTTIAQTAPVIVVNGKGTITLSHASSGVTAAVYGNGSIIPSITVDAFGHITGAVNTTVAISAAQVTSGTLAVAQGGTGQSAYTNGQILIGNTGSTGLDKATIAQSAPIIITNLQGSITVSHARSGVTAVDSYGSGSIIPVFAVDANGHLTAVVNTAIAGLSTGVLTTGILSVARGGTGKDATGLVNGQILIANTVNTGFDLAAVTQTAPVIVSTDKGSIRLSHARSGVTAATYGSASLIPVITVDDNGHITTATTATAASGGGGVTLGLSVAVAFGYCMP